MHLPAMYFTILESWAPFYAVLVIGHAPPHLVYYGAQEMWRPCRTQSPVSGTRFPALYFTALGTQGKLCRDLSLLSGTRLWTLYFTVLES